MVDHMDHAIGQIIDALKSTAQFDNTLIFIVTTTVPVLKYFTEKAGVSLTTSWLRPNNRAASCRGQCLQCPDGGTVDLRQCGAELGLRPEYSDAPLQEERPQWWCMHTRNHALAVGLKTEPGSISRQRGHVVDFDGHLP